MKTYRHSGTLGDLIYSLYIVKKMGGGQFQVGIENLEPCLTKYGYDPAGVDTQHRGRFTTQDFEWLAPLLERQTYITDVVTWHPGDTEPEVDLDRYRAVLYRTFEGNILQAYHKTFDIPFLMSDYDTPWLEADARTVKPIVVTRSARYRPADGEEGWRNIIETGMLADNAVFVGIPKEYEDFTKTFGIDLEYYQATDFLELANVVAGADLVVCNQGFTYSLAIGLGRPTVLEANKLVPLQMNECFFPRTTCQYF
jgi:hypothetical protein